MKPFLQMSGYNEKNGCQELSIRRNRSNTQTTEALWLLMSRLLDNRGIAGKYYVKNTHNIREKT